MQIITPYDIRLLTYDSTTRGYDGRLIVDRAKAIAPDTCSALSSVANSIPTKAIFILLKIEVSKQEINYLIRN